MVKVELDLWDATEVMMFAGLTTNLGEYRETLRNQVNGLTTLGPPSVGLPAMPAFELTPLGHPDHCDAIKPSSPVPDQLDYASVEKHLRGYLERKGLAAAQALLAEFKAHRLSEVPQEKLAELAQRLAE